MKTMQVVASAFRKMRVYRCQLAGICEIIKVYRCQLAGICEIIQSLRAFRRAGKGAKRKVVSDGHGARVEGKGGMRAKVEGPCKGARVKGMERS